MKRRTKQGKMSSQSRDVSCYGNANVILLFSLVRQRQEYVPQTEISIQKSLKCYQHCRFYKITCWRADQHKSCNSPQPARGKDMDAKGGISQPLKNFTFFSLETPLKIFLGFEDKFDFSIRMKGTVQNCLVILLRSVLYLLSQ